jgi:hypothetical protein
MAELDLLLVPRVGFSVNTLLYMCPPFTVIKKILICPEGDNLKLNFPTAKAENTRNSAFPRWSLGRISGTKVSKKILIEMALSTRKSLPSLHHSIYSSVRT